MGEEVAVPHEPSADNGTGREMNQHVAQDSFRTRYLFTLFLFAVYLVHGTSNNVLGPGMLDLEYLTDSPTSSVAAAFTWRYGFYVLASLLTGPIIDTVNECVVIAMALVTMSVSTALMPTFRSLPGLYITNAFVRIGAAVNSICVAATIIQVWGEDAKPYQHALHLCRTLGAALTPQLMKPFMGLIAVAKQSAKGYYNSSLVHQVGNHTYLQGNISHEVLKKNTVFNIQPPHMTGTHILYSFLIIAAFLGILSISSFAIFTYHGCRFWKNTAKYTTMDNRGAVIKEKAKVVLLVLFFLQSMMYAGIEEVVGSFLLTFVVLFLGWSKELGSDIATFFWIWITLSRVIGIILARYFQSSKLFVMQLGVILISIVILIFAIQTHWIVTWICFAAIGLGGGSLFPTLINWGQECMNLQGKETAVFFAGTACAKMAFPPLIGYLFENLGGEWFLYMIFAQVVFFIICYVTTVVYMHCLDRIGQKDMIQENSPLVPLIIN